MNLIFAKKIQIRTEKIGIKIREEEKNGLILEQFAKQSDNNPPIFRKLEMAVLSMIGWNIQ
jgi:hypothetical protein